MKPQELVRDLKQNKCQVGKTDFGKKKSAKNIVKTTSSCNMVAEGFLRFSKEWSVLPSKWKAENESDFCL